MKTSKSPTKRVTTPGQNQNKDRNNSEKVDSICDICAQNVPGPERQKIFAFGKCDHHVCYVCSARLRAICDQAECPICREKLESVIFTSNRNRSFDKYNLKQFLHDTKYNIYFENEITKSAFDKLLKFQCFECIKNTKDDQASNEQVRRPPALINHNSFDNGRTNGEFSDVFSLKIHLNNAHKLKLCDLCLTHNKLFPFEYSYYDANALRKHVKDGEPKTSHRGHPNCSLCHDTFFNTDELLQHMSREHFHCHLCGRQDSNMLIYFADYESLRQHFKAKHFLCERDNCRHEQFTSAFDSPLDLRLHIVEVHGNSTAGISRGEARLQRTITLDAAPHRQTASNVRQSNVPHNAAAVSVGSIATANNPRQQVPGFIQAQIRQQRLPSQAEFPALGQLGSSSSSLQPYHQDNPQSSREGNQYPDLAQASSNQSSRYATLSQRLVAGPSSSRGSFLRSVGAGQRAPNQLNEVEFPPLPEQPKPKGSNKQKVTQQKSTKNRSIGLTLDQLLSSNLTLSARNNNRNKSNKNSKPKALKIQL